MKARNKNPFILFVQWLHVKLYQWSGGRLGTQLLDMPILILTTIGRRTGKKRDRALTYAEMGTDYFVVASNGGSDFHPGWWLNLRAQLIAEIHVGATKIAVQAEELRDTDRQEIWNLFVAMETRYLEYERVTQRRIPVIRLRPLN